MRLVKCANRHFFDCEKYNVCPTCGGVAVHEVGTGNHSKSAEKKDEENLAKGENNVGEHLKNLAQQKKEAALEKGINKAELKEKQRLDKKIEKEKKKQLKLARKQGEMEEEELPAEEETATQLGATMKLDMQEEPRSKELAENEWQETLEKRTVAPVKEQGPMTVKFDFDNEADKFFVDDDMTKAPKAMDRTEQKETFKPMAEIGEQKEVLKPEGEARELPVETAKEFTPHDAMTMSFYESMEPKREEPCLSKSVAPVREVIKEQTPSIEVVKETGKTVSFYSVEESDEPVVGWLVALSGPQRGNSYDLHVGRNSIGRAPGNEVVIAGDEQISRAHHAEIVYDPRSHKFYFVDTSDERSCMVNGESLDGMKELKMKDKLQLGQTTLDFVPFCSEEFDWKD